jgi:hypothetical protein
MIMSSLGPGVVSGPRGGRPSLVVRMGGILLGGLAVGVAVGLALPAR